MSQKLMNLQYFYISPYFNIHFIVFELLFSLRTRYDSLPFCFSSRIFLVQYESMLLFMKTSKQDFIVFLLKRFTPPHSFDDNNVLVKTDSIILVSREKKTDVGSCVKVIL